MVTSQKCKESKKCATYSIHHFRKQDLSANNSLPSFADDLNVHKKPNLSKSSTFNITADNFSSLDNNFLKLNDSEQPFICKSSNSDSVSDSVSPSVNKSIPQNFSVSSNEIKYCLASSTGVEHTSCDINSNKRSHSSLSCSDTSSKSFLSTVSQINTSFNVKYSSFETEDPLSLEDGVLSDGSVDSSCICKSKYDVATYRENTPHLSYGEKVDLIKNVFVHENLLLSRNNKIF